VVCVARVTYRRGVHAPTVTEDGSPRWADVRSRGVAVTVLALVVASGVVPCAFRTLTGFPCPTCGFSRASFALLGLDVRHAFELHPLVFLGLPAIVFATSAWITAPITGRPPRAIGWLAIGFVALSLAIWAARLAGFLGGLPP
jgi:hypothetical protein